MKNPAYLQFFAVIGTCTNMLHTDGKGVPTTPAPIETAAVTVTQQMSSAATIPSTLTPVPEIRVAPKNPLGVIPATANSPQVIAFSPAATVVGTYKVMSPEAVAAADQAAALAKANKKLTQLELAKAGALKYLRTLPERLSQHLRDFMGMGDFYLYANEAEHHPSRTPFRIFDFAKDRIQPSLAWSLSFQNASYQFRDQLDVEWGLCAGVTYLQRRLNMLAHYDFENKWNQSIPDGSVNREMYINFLKSKIDEIMNLQMTIIPGFHNLYELSSVPEIKVYLKEKVVELWATENVDILQGINQGLLATRKENLSPEEMDELYEKITTRVGYGYSPIVYLLQHSDHPFKAEGQWIHTLAITSVSKRYKSGGFSFHVWDINESGDRADSKVIVHKDGHPYYEGRKLGDVELLQWDDLEIAKSIEKNTEFCKKYPGICHDPLEKK